MRIGTTSYRNIQNGPQTLRGVRETAIVKPIGEGMKLKQRHRSAVQLFQASNLFLWVQRPVCVRPGWKPQRQFFLLLWLMYDVACLRRLYVCIHE